jgi:Tfp pilus assembly protein PilN
MSPLTTVIFAWDALTLLLVAWACLTVVLVVLLIYRSTLTIHEEDQLFLSEAESQLEAEQKENSRRIERVTPFVRVFGAASGALILVIAGVWIYRMLQIANQ